MSNMLIRQATWPLDSDSFCASASDSFESDPKSLFDTLPSYHGLTPSRSGVRLQLEPAALLFRHLAIHGLAEDAFDRNFDGVTGRGSLESHLGYSLNCRIAFGSRNTICG